MSKNEKLLRAQEKLDLRNKIRELELRVNQLKTALEFYKKQGTFIPYDGTPGLEDYGSRAHDELKRK